jgi:hypothetical protein
MRVTLTAAEAGPTDLASRAVRLADQAAFSLLQSHLRVAAKNGVAGSVAPLSAPPTFDRKT